MLKNKNGISLIILVLIVVLVIVVGAVTVVLLTNKDNNGSSENNTDLNTPINQNQAETNTNKPNANVEENNSSKNNKLTSTYKVPLQKIYIDVPNYNLIEEGYTRIFWNKGISYVTFTCLYEDTASIVSEAHTKTFQTFVQNVQDHHFVNELGKVKEKNITVNGIDTYNYEGVVSAGRNPIYNAYTYGYSFIYNGFPCAIIGVVRDEDQPQSEINNVKEIVDAMMKTVRNTK